MEDLLKFASGFSLGAFTFAFIAYAVKARRERKRREMYRRPENADWRRRYSTGFDHLVDALEYSRVEQHERRLCVEFGLRTSWENLPEHELGAIEMSES